MLACRTTELPLMTRRRPIVRSPQKGKQDSLSLDVHFEECRRELARRGRTEVGAFSDAAQSAAASHRSGIQGLLEATASGEVDTPWVATRAASLMAMRSVSSTM